jgi:hypothetical protein
LDPFWARSMKSSFAWRYANACEGEFQFRLRQDKGFRCKIFKLSSDGPIVAKDGAEIDIEIFETESKDLLAEASLRAWFA